MLSSLFKTYVLSNPNNNEPLEALRNFIKKDLITDSIEDRVFVLTGFSGAGKTTLVQIIANEIIENNLKVNYKKRSFVIMSAPTNKAVKVLIDKARSANLDIDTETYEDTSKYIKQDPLKVSFNTVHRLLNLTPVIDYKTGEEYFVPTKRDVYKIPSDLSVLLFIDEASMISKDIYQYLEKTLTSCRNCKIIFVGDPAQLPPINETQSVVFEPNKFNYYSHINGIQRYQGAVQECVNNIRDNLNNEFIDLSSYHNQNDINVFNESLWLKNLRLAFKNPSHDIDKVRALCWTNNQRNFLNNFIRRSIYGKNSATYEKGELLVALRPVRTKTNTVLMHTSDECIVNFIVAGYETVIFKEQPPSVECREAWEQVKSISDFTYSVYLLSTDKGEFQVIRDTDKYQQDLRTFKTCAKKANEKDKKFWWLCYYHLRDSFTSLDYAHCLSTHRSQGSTFESVFIHTQDIFRNRRITERNQCLYVASSRASKEINFLSVN